MSYRTIVVSTCIEMVWLIESIVSQQWMHVEVKIGISVVCME